MKLLVVLLCLLSERFLIHTIAHQRFYWFNDYYLAIKKILDKNAVFSNPWLLLAGIITPLIVLIAIVYFLLHGILFGLVGLILNIIIFYYCLGPDNAFYPMQSTSTDEANIPYFAIVNRQLFAVVFWYVVAGPIAVLTYRLITLSREIAPVSEQANEVAEVLEWLPARMTVLLYLLVGNFQRGFTRFSQFFLSNPNTNDKMLNDCGVLAVSSNEVDEIPLTTAETLVEHSVIVLLVFIALFTIVAWL
jgi:AmpE protein